MKANKKDKLIWMLLYMSDNCLLGTHNAILKKLDNMSDVGANDEWLNLSKRIKSMQTETMNKVEQYQDVITACFSNQREAIDFYRTIAGAMQLIEKMVQSPYITNKLYKEYGLMDYIDYFNNREEEASLEMGVDNAD